MTGKHGLGIKGITAAVLAAFALATLSACSLLTPSRADVAPEEVRTKLTTPSIATRGVLTVGISSANAPQVMTDAEGQLTGYAIDVARALGKSLGLSVTFVTNGNASKVGGTGEPDIYLGATSADASSTVTVSGDYLEDAPALFTKGSADASSASSASASSQLSMENLSGATVAVQTGSSAAKALSASGIDVTAKPYANANDCLKALEDGEVQYAALSAATGAYVARSYPDLVMAGTIDAPTAYGVAVRSTSVELADAIGKAMDEISSNGVLDAIHLAWYGSLPLDLSDTLISGVTTSAERSQEQQASSGQASEDSGSEAADASDAASAGGASS